jgi:hypothetical protein
VLGSSEDPSPPGFDAAKIEPATAGFDPQLGEFILNYGRVQASANPDDAPLRFFQTA